MRLRCGKVIFRHRINHEEVKLAKIFQLEYRYKQKIFKMDKYQPKAFTERPIWSSVAPFAIPEDAGNKEHFCDDEDAVARITDVSVPTVSFYPATAVDLKPRPAVLVCPSGGYSVLAWNREGLDTVSWLNYHGISAFLLKYRCPGRREAALADAARAMRIIRSEAEALNILSDKIGIISYSAGAHLATRVCNISDGKAPYEPVDSIGALPCCPDFQMIIYPAYIDREGFGADPDLAITEKTPPAFMMQAEDDWSHRQCNLLLYRTKESESAS